MKAILLTLGLSAFGIASAQSVPTPTLKTPSLSLDHGPQLALQPGTVRMEAFGAPLQSADLKNAQVWIGIPSLSYEHFSGDKAGDEFGFSPTNYLGYQRNFYPDGRLKNGIGYSLGIGAAALGAAVFYHQGAGKGVDFRAGIAADFVYYDNFSYFGDKSHFIALPFVAWGIKI